MITPAQRAEIRRLYFGEHWKIGTLAAALGVHHETVRAALQHGTGGTRRGVSRPSALDPFLPFIRDTLAQYPRLRATRLHEMLRQRGYLGSAVQVRRLVRRVRPQAVTHVYRRVVTWPANRHRWTGAPLGRSASAMACEWSRGSSWSSATRAPSSHCSHWIKHSRASSAGTWRPSRPWAGVRGRQRS